MRCLIAISLLFVALAGMPGTPPVSAQAEDDTAGMSGIDILEGLTSQDPGIRDRAKEELPLMGEKAAKDLGREVLLAGVREAQTALGYVGNAGSDNAVYAAVTGLDSDEYDVRVAALEALIQLSPKHTGAVGKPFDAKRKAAIRKLLDDSDFIEELCKGVKRDQDGEMIKPVTRSMRVMTLLDRLFGVQALPLLMDGISDVMLGKPLSEEGDETQTERDERERLRRAAALWCEAVWIADPAIQFNYQPTAPYEERHGAVQNIRKRVNEMKTRDVELGGEKYTGLRYGDYLWEQRGSDVSGNKAAAYLRLQWWKGDDVIIEGEGYPEAVDELSNMGRRELVPIRRAIQSWWAKYRAENSAD